MISIVLLDTNTPGDITVSESLRKSDASETLRKIYL